MRCPLPRVPSDQTRTDPLREPARGRGRGRGPAAVWRRMRRRCRATGALSDWRPTGQTARKCRCCRSDRRPHRPRQRDCSAARRADRRPALRQSTPALAEWPITRRPHRRSRNASRPTTTAHGGWMVAGVQERRSAKGCDGAVGCACTRACMSVRPLPISFSGDGTIRLLTIRRDRRIRARPNCESPRRTCRTRVWFRSPAKQRPCA
jgi:hypothetical protein